MSRLLGTLKAGDAGAADRLFPAMYAELQALAQAALNDEGPGHTLGATALVHEAYLKLVDQRGVTWQNRAQFFSVAAQAMRRILVDHARGKNRDKRGGPATRRIELTEATALLPDREIDLVALDEALVRLAADEPLNARIVEMRFFAGLSVEEIAQMLSVTDRTVRRHWNYAKAWLYREISKGDTGAHDAERRATLSDSGEL